MWRSLTNAHALFRSNYHIKVSLLILNTVLIATLDNLLNCSIMRPVLPTLSPSSTSLEALRIHARFPRCDFVGCGADHAGTLCTLFMEITAGRCNAPHSAYFKGWLLCGWLHHFTYSIRWLSGHILENAMLQINVASLGGMEWVHVCVCTRAWKHCANKKW